MRADHAAYDYNYIDKKLNKLEEKAKFMMQFEGGSEYYSGFLEAIKEVRKILDEAEDISDDCATILEQIEADMRAAEEKEGKSSTKLRGEGKIELICSICGVTS